MGMTTGIGSSNVKTITVKNADGSVAATFGVSKSNKSKSTKKKRLQYNFEEISSMIMRAKTSGSARQAMSKARAKVAFLRRKLKGDEYDEKELQSAIMHAEQMARIAKKRMKHLQEEESVKRQGGVCQAELDEENEEFNPEDMEEQETREMSSEEMKKFMQELQAALEESESADEPEELEGAVREDMDPADLELLKKKHRLKELREIMEADMKYLKALFDKLEKDKQQTSNSISGVSMEIAGMEMPIQVTEEPVMTEGGSIDVSV